LQAEKQKFVLAPSKIENFLVCKVYLKIALVQWMG